MKTGSLQRFIACFLGVVFWPAAVPIGYVYVRWLAKERRILHPTFAVVAIGCSVIALWLICSGLNHVAQHVLLSKLLIVYILLWPITFGAVKAAFLGEYQLQRKGY